MSRTRYIGRKETARVGKWRFFKYIHRKLLTQIFGVVKLNHTIKKVEKKVEKKKKNGQKIRSNSKRVTN